VVGLFHVLGNLLLLFGAIQLFGRPALPKGVMQKGCKM
jgi:hypothetical protein